MTRSSARKPRPLEERTARARLTPRQRAIMRLVGRGLTQGQIAARLTISRRTVEEHLADIRARLGVPSTALALAIWAGSLPARDPRWNPRRGLPAGEADEALVSQALRFEILRRDDFTCQYCGRRAPDVVLHVDHILARARGGSNDASNLITSCRDCNLGKGISESTGPITDGESTATGEPSPA